jgi:hypothetical protein
VSQRRPTPELPAPAAQPAPAARAAPAPPARRPADGARAPGLDLGRLSVLPGTAPGGANRPAVSRPDDAHEREADHIADRLVAEAGPAAAEAPPPPPGAGAALPAPARGFFERQLGRDFGDVRLHTDGGAARAAEGVSARAVTRADQIAFGAGQLAGGGASSFRLLAHEMVHVAQEQQARGVSAGARGGPFIPVGGVGGAGAGTTLHRQPAPEAPGPVEAPAAPTPAPAAAPAAADAFVDLLDYDAIAAEIHTAVDGWGTDEEGVYRALHRLARHPEAIRRLKERYKALYKIELVDDIRGDFSDTELELALQLLNEGTAGSGQAIDAAVPGDADAAGWKRVATRLHDAFEGWGTDEEAAFAALTPFQRDAAKLTKLKTVYQGLFNETLRDRIDSEMSGSERDYAFWLLGEESLTEPAQQARDVLEFIESEARKRAKVQQAVDTSSKFYETLTKRYLADYFAAPSKAEGKKVVEEGIGRQMEVKRGKVGSQDVVMVRPKGGAWRAADNNWERMALQWLNNQKLPAQIGQMKDLPMLKNLQGLPTQLGAATDILTKENTDKLGFLDVPFLLGKPNDEIADFDADVLKGGKNISQLMHWATGVKYAAQSPEAMRELFLAYELWHLEGWDVFGQDALNDLIAESQGRLLGAELLKGADGALKSEADLAPFLNRSFTEARAWVGTLLRERRSELNAWILSKEQPAASIHWRKDPQWQWKLWNSPTIHQMLADGMKLEDVKKSSMVTSAIEIYTLVFEADEWDRTNQPFQLTELEKALLSHKLDKLLEVMAKAEDGNASLGDLLGAKSAIDDLKQAK